MDFLGDNCSAVLPTAGGEIVFAALDHGHFGVKLHRSNDAGESWAEIAPPAYPPKKEGDADWLDMHGRAIPHSLELIWCLEADHASRPGGIWCGTIPGGLFYSPDNGDAWQLVEGLWNHPLRRRWFGGGMDYPGIHSVCLAPGDANCVRIAVSCGGVWVSDDAGKNWACDGEGWRAEFMPPDQVADPAIQDVHRLQACPAAPEVLWAQHHNGIFRSTDARTCRRSMRCGLPAGKRSRSYSFGDKAFRRAPGVQIAVILGLTLWACVPAGLKHRPRHYNHVVSLSARA